VTDERVAYAAVDVLQRSLLSSPTALISAFDSPLSPFTTPTALYASTLKKRLHAIGLHLICTQFLRIRRTQHLWLTVQYYQSVIEAGPQKQRSKQSSCENILGRPAGIIYRPCSSVLALWL